MVAVVTGAGLGLERSSAWILGAAGQWGRAATGRANDNVYVNAATGNLTVQNTDEILTGYGPDDVVARTYNSQGALSATVDGDNGDRWLMSPYRKVVPSGTPNTTGSTVTRFDWDGSTQDYTWDGARYSTTDGAGAYDTLAYNATTQVWMWTDGDTQATETYDGNNGGRITGRNDTAGNHLTYEYSGTLLSKVITDNGEETRFIYGGTNGTQLSEVQTWKHPDILADNQRGTAADALAKMTRVHYTYDSSNRLHEVLVDLSPEDNATTDNYIYKTTYEYDLAGRLGAIGQTDGSRLEIEYDSSGRVNLLRQVMPGGTDRVTGLEYFGSSTLITDPLGLQTTLTYDTDKQLKSITAPPPVVGGANQVTSFDYDNAGNVEKVTLPDGTFTQYNYTDPQLAKIGLWRTRIDGAGNHTERTYGSKNELLTETVHPSGGEADTTRYAYDSQDHLRFVVSAEGDVTEYVWIDGLQTSVIEYTASTYNVSGLAADVSIPESTLTTWAAAQDHTAAKRTDIDYDFRGNVKRTTSYSTLQANGAGVMTDISRTEFIYDSAGRLLQQQPLDATNPQVFHYDGLGRVVSSVDFANNTTTIAFNDSATTTVVTLANGLHQTSTYNKAGDLISYSEAGTGVSTATTSYAYDADGRLRRVTDPLNLVSDILYDDEGRKTADIAPDGTFVEYRYNPDNLLATTIEYATKMDPGVKSTLDATADTPLAKPTVATYRPLRDDAHDRWSWRIYDQDQRLVETIDPAGHVVVYEYDGASQLVRTTAYATPLTSNQLDGLRNGAAPGVNGLVLPTPTPGSGTGQVRNGNNNSSTASTLTGTGGDDTINTYTAADIMTGGAGYDTFAFHTLPWNAGHITDFTIGQDRLDLTGVLQEIGYTGPDPIRDGYLLLESDGNGGTAVKIDRNGPAPDQDWPVTLAYLDNVAPSSLNWSAFKGPTPLVLSGNDNGPSTLIGGTGGDTLNGSHTADVLTGGAGPDVFAFHTAPWSAGHITDFTLGVDRLDLSDILDGIGYVGSDPVADGYVQLLSDGAGGTEVKVDMNGPAPDQDWPYTVTRLDHISPTGLSWTSLTTVTPTPAVEGSLDRVERMFYDKDGRQVGTLDAEGYLTRNIYDGAGQIVQTVAYANRAADNLRMGGSFAQLLTSVGTSASDVHKWFVYDGRGLLRAEFDGEGDLTRYNYDAGGFLAETVRGEKRDPAVLLATPPTLANLGARPSSGLEVTTYVRDAWGKVLTETRQRNDTLVVTDPTALPGTSPFTSRAAPAEVVEYTYDEMQQLVKTVSHWDTALDAQRIEQVVYDKRGRVIWTLPGRAAAEVATLASNATDAQKQAVYAKYGTNYVYDEDDRLIRKLEPNGTDAGDSTNGPQLKTVYYYDDVGQLKYEIHASGQGDDAGRLQPWGEATSYVYDTFGEVTETRVHATRVTQANFQAMMGGRATTAIEAQVPVSDADTHTISTYNLDGELETFKEAVHDTTTATTTFAYDAFGDLIRRVDPLTDALNTTSIFAYDRRGLLTAETRDRTVQGQTGLDLTTVHVYDAFGREVQTVDPAGRIRSAGYDRAGRTIVTRDARGAKTAYTYDARGALLTMTDRTGAQTHYEYSAFDRALKVTTADGVVTRTTWNDHGQLFSVVVGEPPASGQMDMRRSTQWTYDADGNLSATTSRSQSLYDDPPASKVTNAYDLAGRLIETVDARGYRTTYSYDAANRVFTQTVDPHLVANDSHLGLTTTYTYDAKGQQVRITDPASRVTDIAYDLTGRRTTVTQYPSAGQSIQTIYDYDLAGRTVKITEGAGSANAYGTAPRITEYTYDNADRLTKTVVDPNGLAITTKYSYDKVGNVVRRIDANDADETHVTRFVYDAENRQVLSIDAVGDVVRRSYDAEGRVTVEKAFATLLSTADLGQLSDTSTEAFVLGKVQPAAGDHVTGYVYTGDGRLKWKVDARGQVCGYVYNSFGDLAQTIEYAAPIAAAQSYSDGYVQSQMTAHGLVGDPNNRITRYIYEPSGRLGFVIDAAGGVVRTTYDKSGNPLVRLAYHDRYQGDPTAQPTFQEMHFWNVAHQTIEQEATRTVWDDANRPAFTLDAEGYVTKNTFDGSGNIIAVTRYDTPLTINSTATPESVATAVASMGAVTTNYHYDGANRLDDVEDPNHIHTHYDLDRMGNVINEIRASNYPDNSVTTHFQYDAAGRMTDKYEAWQTAEVFHTNYVHDDFGNVTALTEGQNFTATRHYDKLERLDDAGDPSLDDGTLVHTKYTYDAFGNVSTIVRGDAGGLANAANSVAHFYYDELNRQIRQIDAEGYVTDTTYTRGDKPQTVTRYAAQVAFRDATSPVPASADPHRVNATTTFGYDKMDRLTSVTDAENHTESYQLDVFGNRVVITNKLGGVTQNTFDRRNLLVLKTLPVASFTATGAVEQQQNDTDIPAGQPQPATSQLIQNRYYYDSRGNLVRQKEAYRLSEQRTTTFTYDAGDRLIEKMGDQLAVKSETDLNASDTIRPERTIYDARGNVVETVDAAGAHTYFYYDHLDRKTAEVDAVGDLTEWTYDAKGDLASSKVYDQKVALPAPTPQGISMIGTARTQPSGSGNARETQFHYDAGHRLMTTTQLGVRYGYYDDQGAYHTANGSLVTTDHYDVSGNLIQHEDANLNSTYYFYDKLGRQTAKIEPGNFLTRWTLDAEGNVTKEERFANPVTNPTNPNNFGIVADATRDRVTDFEYDRNGRRVAETRLHVIFGTIRPEDGDLSDFSGLNVDGPSLRVGDARIEYHYNEMGEVDQKKEATNEVWNYGYDLAGRLTSETDPTFTNYLGQADHRQLTYLYNGLGDVVRLREAGTATGAETARDTTYTYGLGGRLESMRDAANSLFTFYYDAAGRVRLREYVRERAVDNYTPTARTEGDVLSYDALGRQVLEARAYKDINGNWVHGELSVTRYNAHGEISERGTLASNADRQHLQDVPAHLQETYEYDNAGRLWRTNEGDGSFKGFISDKNGNRTLVVTSSGAGDVSSFASQDAMANDLFGSNPSQGYVRTGMIYDARDQRTREIDFARQLSATLTDDLEHRWTYNAFGEVVSEQNAQDVEDAAIQDGYIRRTDYTYNTLGKLIKTEHETIKYTDHTGTEFTPANANQANRSTEQSIYDLSGRRVGVISARGNLTTYDLMAGTGYQGTEAVVTAEYQPTVNDHPNASSGRTTYGVDAFGLARWISERVTAAGDESYVSEKDRVEVRTYDNLGRLIEIARPKDLVDNYRASMFASLPLGLHEHYTYDVLGQRLSRWNSVYGATNAETTDYDLEGRVRRTAIEGVAGTMTTYNYEWHSDYNTPGLSSTSYGGWLKTITPPSGRIEEQKLDYFGHMISRTTDKYGTSVTFSFTYDKAARLTHETSTTFFGGSKDTNYEYYNTGLVSQIDDRSGSMGYPVLRTSFSYDRNGNVLHETYQGGAYQNPTNGTGFTPSVTFKDVTATYDLQNRILDITETNRTSASDTNGQTLHLAYRYTAAGDVRALTHQVDSAAAITDWYAYDNMDRMTVAQGVVQNGEIVRGATGKDIAYNLVGQRISTTFEASVPQITYEYADQPRTVNNQPVTHTENYTYSADGFLTEVKESDYYEPAGEYVANNKLVSQDVRDDLGRVTTHTEYDVSSDNWYGQDTNGNSLPGDKIYEQTYSYNDSRSDITQDTVKRYTNGSLTSTQVTDHDYKAYDSTNGTYTGAYQGVEVHSTITTTIVNGGTTTQSRSVDYDWSDGPRQLAIHVTGSSPADTYFHYDPNGNLRSVDVGGNNAHTMTYVSEANGSVLSRRDSATNGPLNRFFTLAGMQVGAVGNDGKLDGDYVEAINRRNLVPGFFPDVYADFDNYQGVTPSSPLESPVAQTYVVEAGDTLQSIAARVWGDDRLWWVLADANGLNGTETLPAGMRLTVPAKVLNAHFTQGAFRIYDPSQTQGDVEPLQQLQVVQAQPKHHGGCGAVGEILLVLVAEVVTKLVALVLPGPIGYIAAAVIGDIVSQGVGVATGQREKFSWNEVGVTALTAGISKGVDKFAPKLAPSVFEGAGWQNVAARAALTNTLTQGVSVATGLRQKFSWADVATSAVVAGVGAAVGDSGLVRGAASQAAGQFTNAKVQEEVFDLVRDGISNLAGGVTGAATRSLLTGTDFGDNVRAVLPTVIAQTLGNTIGRQIDLAAARRREADQVSTGSSTNVLLGSNDGDILTGGAAFYGAASVDQFAANANARAPDARPSFWRRLASGFNNFIHDPVGAAIRVVNPGFTWSGLEQNYTRGVTTLAQGFMAGANQVEGVVVTAAKADYVGFAQRSVQAFNQAWSGRQEGTNYGLLQNPGYVSSPDAANRMALWNRQANFLASSGHIAEAANFRLYAVDPKAAIKAHWLGFGKDLLNTVIAAGEAIARDRAGPLGPQINVPRISIRPEEMVGAHTFSATVTAASLVAPVAASELASARGLSLTRTAPLEFSTAETSGPRTFANLFPADEIGPPIQTFQPSQLGNLTRKLNYVVTEDGQLILGRIDNTAVGGGHIDLAAGRPVQAAGEVKTVAGEIRYIDNSSGHYLPTGPSAQEAALTAFRRNGFDVPDSLYIEKVWNPAAGRWVPK